jgi:UDPglucose 6-dehydrogenase
MKSLSIGIVGLGYVGSACSEVFSQFFNVNTFDIQKKSTENSLSDLVLNSEIIFLCLPTPMNTDGSCNFDIIDQTLNEINQISNVSCVIKSTIPPGTTSYFQNKFKNLKFFFNPEFLTEANFVNDFKNQDKIIIGSGDTNFSIIDEVYKESFPNTSIIHCPFEEAELVKYVINTFLAVKVSFANEIYSLCENLDIDYSTIKEIVAKDKRIGSSHLSVPGPDGKFGFGGSCFPKDINSLLDIFKKNQLKSYVINSAWSRNIKIDRTEKDWEQLKGRAIVSDE